MGPWYFCNPLNSPVIRANAMTAFPRAESSGSFRDTTLTIFFGSSMYYRLSKFERPCPSRYVFTRCKDTKTRALGSNHMYRTGFKLASLLIYHSLGLLRQHSDVFGWDVPLTKPIVEVIQPALPRFMGRTTSSAQKTITDRMGKPSFRCGRKSSASTIIIMHVSGIHS